MIVLDASLAVKLVIPEDGSEKAAALFDREAGRIQAPDLLWIEVASAVVRLTNQRVLSRDLGDAALVRWAELSSETRMTAHRLRRDLVDTAARMAIELGHPIKDCVYLALAAELGCPLVTCDVKFRERAGERYAAVRLPGGAGA